MFQENHHNNNDNKTIIIIKDPSRSRHLDPRSKVAWGFVPTAGSAMANRCSMRDQTKHGSRTLCDESQFLPHTCLCPDAGSAMSHRQVATGTRWRDDVTPKRFWRRGWGKGCLGLPISFQISGRKWMHRWRNKISLFNMLCHPLQQPLATRPDTDPSKLCSIMYFSSLVSLSSLASSPALTMSSRHLVARLHPQTKALYGLFFFFFF